MIESEPMPRPIRVLVADDQRVVREGMCLILDLLDDVEVIGSVADGEDAIAQAHEARPDVVLMDLRMPRTDGVEATRRITTELPNVKVIVLTTYADDRSVVLAVRAGARGFLTKDASGQEIAEALRRVAVVGTAAIDPAVQHHLMDAVSRLMPGVDAGPGPMPERPDGLTAREVDVLLVIAAGLSNGEIADALSISEATVKSHINRILAKIGARDRAQAVVYAYRHGLATDGSAGHPGA